MLHCPLDKDRPCRIFYFMRTLGEVSALSTLNSMPYSLAIPWLNKEVPYKRWDGLQENSVREILVPGRW